MCKEQFEKISNSFSDKEVAAIGLWLGFIPSYYEKIWRYEYGNMNIIKECYRITHEQFLEILDNLKKRNMLRNTKECKDFLYKVFRFRTSEKMLASQVHWWAYKSN